MCERILFCSRSVQGKDVCVCDQRRVWVSRGIGRLQEGMEGGVVDVCVVTSHFPLSFFSPDFNYRHGCLSYQSLL